MSQISSRPSGPIAMLCGCRSCACDAGPPSPENPATPVPASVEMTPVAPSTFRTTWLSRSAMYMWPRASNTISCGMFSDPDVAGPPSPRYARWPSPAIVRVVRELQIEPADALVVEIAEIQRAVAADDDAVRDC